MKGKRVLLVNPWIYDFAAYDLWAKPLGLLFLGALLRLNGCEVSFVDCLKAPHEQMGGKPPKVHPGGHGKFYRQIVDSPALLKGFPRRYGRYGISREAFYHDLGKIGEPDAVLVTSQMTYWYPGVHEAVRCVREAFPRAVVLLGGIYATLCGGHAGKHAGADHVLCGEGELEALRVLGRLWRTSPGYCPDMDNLDSLPYPLFDLVEPLRYVCIQTSRGCPFRCTYCASHLLASGLRVRDPHKAVDEVEHWHRRYQIDDFALYDDAFLFRSQRFALPFMQEIVQRRLGVRFHCPNALHARYLSPEVASAMKESGFATIRLGLETSDPVLQEKTGGKVSNDELLHALENLSRAGFDPSDIGVYILCGLPGQHAREVLDAVEFVRSSGARPVITEYSPLPGTGMWEEALRFSRYPLDEDPLFHNNTLLPCAWEGLDLSMYREIRLAAGRSASSALAAGKGAGPE
ncbi:MAG: B12-binding domain-containing radical SAM protein [Desulfomonilia bacterium]|jgi:hypothetical protein|nr:B12-binding domain-containing radical SAM protein [Desulfomonilia bacterium]